MNDEFRMKNDESRPTQSAGATPTEAPTIRQSELVIPLWLWVAAGFLLLAVAWSVLFTVARSAKVESVPLATKEARP
jgi:hypothetical protein